jgi:preprotein translocase subunit SecG
MNIWFVILTGTFIVVAVAMVLIILVQRPSGGGLAGAFGGAGGGTDTVFGGRVGDALTWATVIAFSLYLLSAVALNIVPVTKTVAPPAAAATSDAGAPPPTGTEGTGEAAPGGAPAVPSLPDTLPPGGETTTPPGGGTPDPEPEGGEEPG